jgi:hypothetical protein
MDKEFRRIHHLTEEESRMLLLFRLLTPPIQAAITKIAEKQISEDNRLGDNVVSIGSRTLNQ